MNTMALLFLTADTGRPGIVERVMAEITQVDPVTVTTTGAAASGVSLSLSGILASAALPFLWIFSFLISGQAYGTAFIREAPTLQARRWLTKQFCTLCCIVASFPLPILCLLTFGKINLEYRLVVGSIIIVSLLVTFGIWLVRTKKKYALIEVNPERDEVEYRYLKNYFYINYVGITCLLGTFLFVWIRFILFPGYEYSVENNLWERKIAFVSVAFCMCAFALAMQVSNYFLFRYFLRICKDNETLKSTPLPLDSMPVDQRKKMFWEAVYVFPFVVYFVGPNLIHLILVQKRILCPILEILLYASVWLAVFRFNLENPKTRKWRIAIVFIVLSVIFHVLRRIYD